MCANSSHAASLNIARHGFTSTTWPFTMRKPCGWFIQAFTLTTQNVPTTPDAAIGSSIARCRRGGIRSQP